MSDEMDEVGPTMPCSHTLITIIDGTHHCADCGEPIHLRTASGKIVTPAEVERWAAEAERGYDVAALRENASLGFAATEAIRSGTLDRHLGTIERAIRARRHVLSPPDTAPPRTPEMEANHQHWVWINSPGEPHWEIRGTGVVG